MVKALFEKLQLKAILGMAILIVFSQLVTIAAVFMHNKLVLTFSVLLTLVCLWAIIHKVIKQLQKLSVQSAVNQFIAETLSDDYAIVDETYAIDLISNSLLANKKMAPLISKWQAVKNIKEFLILLDGYTWGALDYSAQPISIHVKIDNYIYPAYLYCYTDFGIKKYIIEFNKQMLDNIFLELCSVVTDYINGNLSARLDVETIAFCNKDTLITACNNINAQLDTLTNALAKVTDCLVLMEKSENISSFDVDNAGCLSVVIAAIYKLHTNFKQKLKNIHDISYHLNIGANQINESNYDLKKRTDNTAASLNDAASGMKELSDIILGANELSNEAVTCASTANKHAVQGKQMFENSLTTMNLIKVHSNKINDIIALINDIAFRTNLLALNASVEAARAGEHGRGFAVVASEVKNLAGNTANAARDIRSLIEQTVESVEQGVVSMHDSNEALMVIDDSINNISQIIQNLSNASQMQSLGLSEINKMLNRVNQFTQQNAAMVTEAAASNESMAVQINNLRGLIEQFNIIDSDINYDQTIMDSILNDFQQDEWS